MTDNDAIYLTTFLYCFLYIWILLCLCAALLALVDDTDNTTKPRD